MGKKNCDNRSVIGIVVLGFVMGTVLFIVDNGTDIKVLDRGDYGEGTEIEELKVTIDGEQDIQVYEMEIEVEERLYTEAEITGIFEKELQALDAIVLGENPSFDQVNHDLNLIEKSEHYPIKIEWKWTPYKVLDTEGILQEEEIPEEGILVELVGTLSYKEQEMQYIQHMMVYPPDQSTVEMWLEEIAEEVTVLDEKSAYEEQFALPSEANGAAITWKKPMEYRGIYVGLLTVVGVIFWFYRKKERIKEMEVRREQELIRDYPELINRIVLLVGAGMTIKKAWRTIVENQDGDRKHILYAEMLVTEREMENGISEADAYERFGNRCNSSCYRKLGHILSQNLRKGSKGLLSILEVEAYEARALRKTTARLLGETAATKLLMPMFLMLVIVLIIIVVPAFLTVQV